MPSREIRRANSKKTETGAEVIEKKKEGHPLLYVFSIILLVIIIVTFVGSPVVGNMGGAGSIVFGSYNGKDIAYFPGSYFAEQRDRLAAQVRANSQDQQETEATIQAIWYQAFLSTARHVAVLIETEKAGMQVSDDTIDKALLTYPGYQEDGKFSEARYQKTSAADRVATRKLYREELLTSQYLNDEMAAAQASTRETAFITDMARPQRSFSFVSYPLASFPQDEVKKFGEANAAKFRKIKVSRIMVKSGEKEAKEIHKKLLEKTSSFEELAKTHSKDGYAEKGGDMGWRYAFDLEADLEKKDLVKDIFALKNGEYSEVLKGAYGWLVYRIDADAVNPDFSDSAMIDEVKAYLTQYEKGKVEDYLSAKADQLSQKAAEIGFDKAAKQLGVSVVNTDFFPINMQNIFSFVPVRANPETATPASAAYSEEFFVKAFSLAKKGDVSKPVVLDDQIMVIAFKDEKQLADAMVNVVPRWVEYVARQSAQSELMQSLVVPEKLKDNFMETFDKYVYSKKRR